MLWENIRRLHQNSASIPPRIQRSQLVLLISLVAIQLIHHPAQMRKARPRRSALGGIHRWMEVRLVGLLLDLVIMVRPVHRHPKLRRRGGGELRVRVFISWR